MYRDEILAIGEAVREAVKAGADATRSELTPKITELDQAVAYLYEVAKRAANVEQVLRPEVESGDPHEQNTILSSLLAEANKRLQQLRKDAQGAIRNSRAQYIQRRMFDPEVPF